ncbi:MAG: fumarylacetoacetate hydrolase family protein [Chloroflexia bacterium]|nr:fumarylacetoacetate hydrolase family protein [Chloroflexia bacterium]
MKGNLVPIARYTYGGDPAPQTGYVDGDAIFPLAAVDGPVTIEAALQLGAADLVAVAKAARNTPSAAISLDAIELLPPIDTQEVWASGVTYSRSRDARMEESTQKDVYDLVYEAERPELFMKATASRVSGSGGTVAIRGDSTWDVPEPELVLVLNGRREIVGYTVGNDVSSRSIEGENPLYLPQAKVYSGCAGLGPWIALTSEITDPNDLAIRLIIDRAGTVNFEDGTSTSQIHRTFDDLTSYLFRHNQFPQGVFLMTGTGIIPPAEFTLEDGDIVRITIDGIGTLHNPVVRLAE